MSWWLILAFGVAAAIGGCVAGAVSEGKKREAFIKRWQEECRRYEAAARAQDPTAKFTTKHYGY